MSHLKAESKQNYFLFFPSALSLRASVFKQTLADSCYVYSLGGGHPQVLLFPFAISLSSFCEKHRHVSMA